MVIWVIMGVASAIPSKGMIGYLLPYLAALVYFATSENEWAKTLHPHFREWLIVWDTHAATDFYEGESLVPWGIWVKPLLVWTVFILLFYALTICLRRNGGTSLGAAAGLNRESKESSIPRNGCFSVFRPTSTNAIVHSVLRSYVFALMLN